MYVLTSHFWLIHHFLIETYYNDDRIHSKFMLMNSVYFSLWHYNLQLSQQYFSRR
eukprot:UN17940